jgi:hypothetical protein
MDAYEYLDPFRDAIECLEELGRANRLPLPGSLFWAEFKAYSERARALWDNGPVLYEIDEQTGQRRVPAADAIMAGAAMLLTRRE